MKIKYKNKGDQVRESTTFIYKILYIYICSLFLFVL